MHSASSFVPPPDVVAAAAYGLDLRARFGRGGTEVGLARARLIVARFPLDHHEMRVISAWFARHGAMRRSAIRPWGQDRDPSAAWIAWHLWGGDPGRAWADALTGRSHDIASGPEAGEIGMMRALKDLALI